MLSVCFAIIALSGGCTLGDTSVGTLQQNIRTDIQILKDINKPRMENPQNFKLQGENKTFTFGNPTPRDVRKAESSEIFIDTTSKNYFIVLRYPHSDDVGTKVTYVKIVIETTSGEAYADIKSGGINEKNIEIALSGKNTYKFAFTVTVYNSASRAQPIIFSIVLMPFVFMRSKIFKI